MSVHPRFRTATWLFLWAAASSACGSPHAPPAGGPVGPLGTGGSSGDAGVAAGGTSSADATMPEGDGTALGGAGGSPQVDSSVGLPDGGTTEPVAVCGDGVRGAGEFCDKQDLHGAECASFGYTGGVLACSATCSFDFSGCTGTELCYDGLDNDGNKKVDCLDPACTAACTDPCAAPTLMLDPGRLNGDTSRHANVLSASCASSGSGSGPEVVFRMVASVTGVLRAVLTSVGPDFSLSLRKTCGDAASELACRDVNAGASATEMVSVPVTEGDEVFLVVDGSDTTEAGIFNLEAHSSAIVCGNAQIDPGEDCDDGNRKSGDGCSASCLLESNEHESNETIATANPYTGAPFVAQISSVSDVDVFSISVTSPNSQISIDTLDVGDGGCANLNLDDHVELLSSTGKSLGANDDANGTFCASLTVTGLAPGTYYVRVTASGKATKFPYDLDVSKSP